MKVYILEAEFKSYYYTTRNILSKDIYNYLKDNDKAFFSEKRTPKIQRSVKEDIYVKGWKETADNLP